MLRGILIGAGGALGVCSQSDTLNDLPRGLLTSALKGYNKISRNNPNDLSETSSQDLQALSDEIRSLKLLSNNRSQDKQIIVYGSGSGASSIVKLVIVGSAGVCVCYYFGFGFNDIMYVTKSTLTKAVSKLEEKVGFVGTKLEKTREQLLAMISSVEESIFSSSEALKEQINHETDIINGKIDGLDGKFERIEISQSDIKNNTNNLHRQIAALQEKFTKNGFELEKANSGIRLLVNSVVDLPHVRVDSSLYSELKNFLGNNISWFRGTETTTNEKEVKKSFEELRRLASSE